MTSTLPASSRRCCGSRPRAAAQQRPSGRSHSTRTDPSTITSPTPTGSRTQISPGIHGADQHPNDHNHSPPRHLTRAPVQISSTWSGAAVAAAQPSTSSACSGPSSRSDRRETAGSSTRPCVDGSPRCRRSRCSVAIGRQSLSTTLLGSPATSSMSRSRCDGPESRRVSRASAASQATRLTSVSLKSEWALRFAEPSVSQRSSTIPTLAWTYDAVGGVARPRPDRGGQEAPLAAVGVGVGQDGELPARVVLAVVGPGGQHHDDAEVPTGGRRSLSARMSTISGDHRNWFSR